MKKSLILTLLMVLTFAVTAMADDIWEPAPPEIDPATIPDLFRWGEDYDSVLRFLSDYEDYGIDIAQDEDGSGPVITYTDDYRNADFTCTFLFTEDTRKLREIRTATVYPAGESASDALELIRKKLKMDKMETYSIEQPETEGQPEFEGSVITADEDTIYYGAYDRGTGARSGQRLYFTFIDRAYYEEQTR